MKRRQLGRHRHGESDPFGFGSVNDGASKTYRFDLGSDITEKLVAMAAKRESRSSKMTRQKSYSVIPCATKFEHVQRNAKAADWQLSEPALTVLQIMIGGEE